jgi:hypothetical protein
LASERDDLCEKKAAPQKETSKAYVRREEQQESSKAYVRREEQQESSTAERKH